MVLTSSLFIFCSFARFTHGFSFVAGLLGRELLAGIPVTFTENYVNRKLTKTYFKTIDRRNLQ